ncbi:MAG TPA: Tol-Pal system subunit TolQ, partial [Sphingomonas sp.]|nr:Tol-Pal system subunit TolQ [Sphingomonas sp.]
MDQLFVNADAATLSPVALFLQADWVVKAVMLGLLLASIWTWAIIIGFGFRLKRQVAQSDAFERDFWTAQDIDRFHD